MVILVFFLVISVNRRLFRYFGSYSGISVVPVILVNRRTAFSRRAVVSYWRKYVHEVLVNRLGGLSLPRKSVVRLTYRPDMTLDVYRGRKTTIQQQQQLDATHPDIERLLQPTLRQSHLLELYSRELIYNLHVNRTKLLFKKYFFLTRELSLSNTCCWRADHDILIHDGEAGVH